MFSGFAVDPPCVLRCERSDAMIRAFSIKCEQGFRGCGTQLDDSI